MSVIAPNDQTAVLNKIAEKSALLTFDSDAPKSNRLLYIGTNNYQAGKTLGKEMVKLLPHGGKIAVFVGTFSADNAAQRLKGIEDAIAGAGIAIVDKREDNTDRAKARSNVEDIVNANHDLAMVVGLYNYNGTAIAAALDGLGKKGKVLAAVFDEDDGTLDGIAARIDPGHGGPEAVPVRLPRVEVDARPGDRRGQGQGGAAGRPHHRHRRRRHQQGRTSRRSARSSRR